MSKDDKGKVEPFEVEEGGDENVERGNWGSKMDFMLSTIGFAVGLGNVWRFPYRAYQNGGASFLIPYIIMLTFAGLPLFFMEMAFGQFSSLGPISVWRAVPLFKGLGYAMVVISGLVCIYYNMIIAYILYYFFASLTARLPWQECQDEWVTKYNCRMRQNATMRNISAEYCISMKAQNFTDDPDYISNCTVKWVTPSEVYWKYIVLDKSNGIDDDPTSLRWQLVLCLLLAWIIIFLCLLKGIKSSGKVVYFTATFPYVVLIILLIRGCTLEGAWEGIKFYIVPDWSKLANPSVWYAAAVQIFYSLGVAFGGLETMASYNKFHNNVYRDSVIVAILNCCTSVFAGFAIFSVMGYMSVKTGVPVDQVAAAGPGLAFIAYPEGLAMMPVAPLWSVIFFFMLFTLGLDSQFAMMETIITAFVDEFRIPHKRKIWVTLSLCIVLFGLGLPQCARNGDYIVELFNTYSAGFSLMVVSLFEVIGIMWIYGFKRFSADIEMMIGHKPNIYWLANWLVITPALLLFVLIMSAVYHAPMKLEDYVYPRWADNIGWGMVGVSVVFIPIMMLVEYCKAHGFLTTMKSLVQPQKRWGPALDKYRSGVYSGTSTGDGDGKLGNDNPAFKNDMSDNYM